MTNIRIIKSIAVTFLFATIVLASAPNPPTEVVKLYWKLSLEKKFEDTKKLKIDAAVFFPTDYEGSAIGADIADPIERKNQDCCYGKEIAENNLRITKVLSAKQKKSLAEVIVEVQDRNKMKATYYNCLSLRDKQWRITKISSHNSKINSDCFPSGKTRDEK